MYDFVTAFSVRLNIGNKANHCTANNIKPNTCAFEGKREAKSTEANIAAFVEKEPGNLNIMNYMKRIIT
jgi:hypothetical protein